MCGIVGVFGKLEIKAERAFKDMLIMDQLRGPHSTGVVSVNRNILDSKFLKKLGGPEELMTDKRFPDLFLGQLGALIGHNRYATKGAINRQNAHPFDFNEVIGVHNGTLSSFYRLDDARDFDVDSEALYNHINNHGPEDALQNIIGAYALMWWNKKEKTVNLLRNEDRPLWMAYSKDLSQVFVASEWWMISGAASRNAIELVDKPGLVPQDHLISFTINKDGLDGKGVMSKMESPKSFYPAGSNTSTVTHFNRGGSHQKGGSQSVLLTASSNQSANSSGNRFQQVDQEILQKKQVLFEVTDDKATQDGARFWLLESELYPEFVFRLFKHNNLPPIGIGNFIRGDVSSAAFEKSLVVYKISPYGVKVEKEGSFIPPEYKDHKGRMIPFGDWIKKYSYCGHCMQEVEPWKEEHVFTTDGSVICGVCIKDPEVKGMIN